MLINEAGLIRAIKRAYKAGGYTVANHGDAISIYAQTWYIQINRALVTNKVLATIVEHMGMIPEVDAPTSVMKDQEPQLVLAEVAADDMAHWRSGQRGEEVTMVPVIMQGYHMCTARSMLRPYQSRPWKTGRAWRSSSEHKPQPPRWQPGKATPDRGGKQLA